MRLIAALTLILTLQPIAAAPATPASDPNARLLSLARLWGDIAYFDPWLAYRAIDWNGAAISAIPSVERAASPKAFASAVASMLATLNDPLARVVPAASPSPQPVAGTGLTLTSSADGTPVLAVNASALAAADDAKLTPEESRIAASLASHRAVIVDLRADSDETDEESAVVDSLFSETPIAGALVHGNLQMPVYRSRTYNGLPSSRPGSPYTAGFHSDDASLVRGTARNPVNVAFLAGNNTVVPDLAVALLRDGRAVIFSNAAQPLLAGGEVSQETMTDGLSALFRVSEYAEVPAASFAQPLPTRSDALAVAAKSLQRDALAPVAFQAAPPANQPAAHDYEPPALPDEAHRIFAVFRIYNTIRYFFPYRALMHEDWDAATIRAIREVRASTTERSYLSAIRGYYALIHDGHGFVDGLLANELYGGAVPWASQYLHGQVVVTSIIDPLACRTAGVRLGDIVTAVDGVPVARALAAQRPFVNGSTPQNVMGNLVSAPGTSIFAGPKVSTIAVSLRRPGSKAPFTAKLRRALGQQRHSRTGAIVRILPGNVGYVDLDRLTPEAVDQMFTTVAKTRAVIFDDRGYPLATFPLIAPRLTLATGVRAARFDMIMALVPQVQDGDTIFQQSFQTFYQLLDTAAGSRYLKPVVMLIDARAISQAEHTALQYSAATKTTFVGTPTDGADGDVTGFSVPGGITLAFSGLGVAHADGRPLQRVGILPDVRAEPTAQDVADGRDVVLEAGLRAALRRSSASPEETVSALKGLRTIERADFAQQNGATEKTAAIQAFELTYTGRSLPGATGTQPLPHPEEDFSSQGPAGRQSLTTWESLDVAPYRGKAVHIFGLLKIASASSDGALWALVNAADGGNWKYDDMGDRALHGTQGWQPFSIVLKVSEDATAIAFGSWLGGPGEIWASHLTVEVIPKEMAI